MCVSLWNHDQNHEHLSDSIKWTLFLIAGLNKLN